MPRLLLVAPDSDLRRSLEFALLAEGYDVLCRANLGSVPADLGPFDCTVVDHHALGTDFAASVAFCSAFAPVILLANHLPHRLSPYANRTLLKPLLGAALSEAVRSAVALAASPK